MCALGRRALFLVVAIACPGVFPAAAEEPGDTKPDLLREAREKAKSGHYEDALALFQEALGTDPQDPALIAEACRCAVDATDYTVAVELARRGLKLIANIKSPTDEERLLSETLGTLQETAKRERQLRDELTPKLEAQLIKNLPRHARVIDSKYMMEVDAGESSLKSWRLKDKYVGAHFDVRIFLNPENGLVLCEVVETHRDLEHAEERFEALRDLIGKEMKSWTKRLRGRTKTYKPVLTEIGNDGVAHLEGPWWKIREIIYAGDPRTGGSTDRSWATKLSIVRPVEPGQEEPLPLAPCQVHLHLRSSHFK
jgi:tetratricopeptide (TPR) repeat protein